MSESYPVYGAESARTLLGPGNRLPGAEADGAVDLVLQGLGHVIDEDDADVVGAELEDFGGGLLALRVAFAHVRIDDDFHSVTSQGHEELGRAPGAAIKRIQGERG